MQHDSRGTILRPARIARGYMTPAFLRCVRRYGSVGLSVSLCYSFATIACVHFVDPTIASVIAFIVTLPIGYLAHKRITFSDSSHDAFQPVRFAVATAASFVLAVGGMYWITEIAGRNYIFGIAWIWFIIPTMNFVLYLLWVFRATGATLANKSRQAHHFE